jgi:hypothetical protein
MTRGTTPERRRLLVVDAHAQDPNGTALKAMIATVLSAAEDGRLASAGYCRMDVRLPRDDHRGDPVGAVRAQGTRMHVRFSHDGPFALTHDDMTVAVVDALRRPVAGPAEAEAELDALGALVAITDAGSRQVVACSATPWQDPLITGEVPLTLKTMMANANRIPQGRPGLVLEELIVETAPVDPEHAPFMADVVHASYDGGDLLLSPLRVEGPRDGFVFPKNLVTCHRTAALPGPMETLRILADLRRCGSSGTRP